MRILQTFDIGQIIRWILCCKSRNSVQGEFARSLFWEINNNSQTIMYNSFDEYGTSSTHQNLDVMYAVAKGQTKANGKVNLTFKHILSQVLFKAKPMMTNWK